MGTRNYSLETCDQSLNFERLLGLASAAIEFFKQERVQRGAIQTKHYAQGLVLHVELTSSINMLDKNSRRVEKDSLFRTDLILNEVEMLQQSLGRNI